MQVHEFFALLEGFRQSDAYLADSNQRLTYAEFLDQVYAVAVTLGERGCQRIGLLADNSIEWLIMDLAALKAGVTLVPIPLFFSQTQQANAIADAQLDALALNTDTLQPLPHTPRPHPAAKITYTSGSTGNPKGVCLTAEHLLTTLSALRNALPAQASSCHLSVLPLAILLENIAGSWLALSYGANLHLPSLSALGYSASNQLDAAAFYQHIQATRAESLILTPALAELIVQGVENQQLAATQFNFLAVGGAAVPNVLMQRAKQADVPLFEGYGLSECGSVVCLNTPSQQRLGSVGKVLNHQRIKAENGQLYTRGSYMLGYLHDKEPCRQDAWQATGDLGHIDADGFVYVAGRVSNLIITSFGRNISPEWIEALAQSNTEWLQFMVFGDGRARLGALISPHPDASEEQINAAISQLNKQLPDYAQLSGWLATHEPFSEQNELLTNNKRLRRKAILKTYNQAIQQFYGD